MSEEERIASQKKERVESLEKILQSNATKKIIVAGAGTGKTFTFKKILEANPSEKNIALTFIRMLSADMYNSFGDLAEVKTFHAYCKKILHEQNGRVDIYPFLSNIIQEDSQYLNQNLSDFDIMFQSLKEDSKEIGFYLKRGDYYDAVSFNDSVYRLYKLLKTDNSIIPEFNQILIDEFQDFNPLEVAFINELEKKGNILIVGDDDQAVYEGRSASSSYLIEKYNSTDYEKFDLPFCSRCPEAIVNATNAFLKKATEKGLLKKRIDKRYECFIEEKVKDSKNYPKIITARCSLGSTVAKYIRYFITQISKDDIDESWKDGSVYPTVLIIGPKQYLKIVYECLIEEFPQIEYKRSVETPLSPLNAYDILLNDLNHNLGWRLLINYFLDKNEIKTIINESDKGKEIVEILKIDFVKNHKRVVEIIIQIKKGDDLAKEILDELNKTTCGFGLKIVAYYKPKESIEKKEFDKTQPSILLTSFVGCKGLSAGFTFIIGAHEGSIPKDSRNIKDIEVSQFVVAITRTRKQCHIISNKWLITPMFRNIFQQPFKKSCFIDWIPDELRDDLGEIDAKAIKALDETHD